MNSLSWMIYVAEVLGNLGIAAAIGFVISMVSIAIGVFVAGLASLDDTRGSGIKILNAVFRKWWVPAIF